MSYLQIIALIIFAPILLSLIAGPVIGILCAIWEAIFGDNK